MNISSNLTGSLTYQPTAKQSPELSNDINFTQEVEKQESIFSAQTKPLSSYTVYNMGEFPDSSFFEDKFPNNTFSQQDGHGVENIVDPEGNIVGYSSPNGYDVWYEYAENSTPENPIMNVRLENKETKEAWEGTMNINNIDPQNASKVEMLVLSQHLTGDSSSMALATTGLDAPFSKENFLAYLQTAIEQAKNDLSFSGNLDSFEELFSVLDKFIEETVSSSQDSGKNSEKSRIAQAFEHEQFNRELMAQIGTDSSVTLRSAFMANS